MALMGFVVNAVVDGEIMPIATELAASFSLDR